MWLHWIKIKMKPKVIISWEVGGSVSTRRRRRQCSFNVLFLTVSWHLIYSFIPPLMYKQSLNDHRLQLPLPQQLTVLSVEYRPYVCTQIVKLDQVNSVTRPQRGLQTCTLFACQPALYTIETLLIYVSYQRLWYDLINNNNNFGCRCCYQANDN